MVERGSVTKRMRITARAYGLRPAPRAVIDDDFFEPRLHLKTRTIIVPPHIAADELALERELLHELLHLNHPQWRESYVQRQTTLMFNRGRR
jgi:hypothetical protein